MPPGLPKDLRGPTIRRAITVPSVAIGAATLAGSIGVWAPIAAVVDLASTRKTVPLVRSLTFALAWSTLESMSVGLSAALWATGNRNDQDTHFNLQRWWADRLVDALRLTANVTFEVQGLDQLAPGPIVVCVNHSSIADALIPVWLLGRVGMRPRYVLKDDLQLDPCLDIVGNRLPNHFVERDPDDITGELTALERLAHDMGPQDACVIYPEGMVVTDTRRDRAKKAIAAREPERARRVRDLRMLAPVRPGGTRALLRGAPGADMVFVMHSGLESLQRLVDAPGTIPLDQPVRIQISRVARRTVPGDEAFARWFDDRWAHCDRRFPAGSSSSASSRSATVS
jgi:1-acyl-sn-glycerol-3-phosphate acyltransferase